MTIQHDQHIHDGFRVVGQDRMALGFRLHEAGFLWKCRWNGVDPSTAPWQLRYASNAVMRNYIKERA